MDELDAEILEGGIYAGISNVSYAVTRVGEARLENSIVTIDGRMDERTLVVVGVEAPIGATFEQDPEALLDYRFDFSAALDPGEFLMETPWFDISPGINLRARFLHPTSVVVWVEGGQAGFRYLVQATVPTTNENVMVAKIAIRVADK